MSAPPTSERPRPTPGSVHCPNHVAVARPNTHPIEWYCRLCEKPLEMVTGVGLR